MRSFASVIVALLAAIYICSLSIQVIAIHKDFRFEISWGPALAILTSSPSKDAQKAKTLDDGVDNVQWNVTSDSTADVLKLINDHMKNADESRTTQAAPEVGHRAPYFLILGAQKSGTQALRIYLWDHPNIVMPRKAPETHYFDKFYSDEQSPNWNLDKYVNDYFHKDCRLDSAKCIAGESTPFYLYDTEHVPARIKAAAPWAKLIVMLRDPVKRAYSQWSMLIDKNEINGSTFEQHLEGDLNRMIDVGLISNRTLTVEEEDEAWIRYQDDSKWRKAMIGRGFYELQLRKWFKYFPRERFLILDSQQLEFERVVTMKRVFEFLGLPYYRSRKAGNNIHRRKYTTTMPDNVRDFLYEFYQPYNQRLIKLLGPEWRGKWEKPVAETTDR